MSNDSLFKIYQDGKGYVSSKWTLYLHKYDQIFEAYRERPINLFEIGIQNGGSLNLWGKFFKNAKHIIGCDINPKCKDLEYSDKRITVVIGDATEKAVKEQVLKKVNYLDVVIDDGSHDSIDIVKAFSQFFPLLSDGGVYVVEDLHCSYWQEFSGGLFNPNSAMSFFKALADVLNHEHWGAKLDCAHFLDEYFKFYGCFISESNLMTIHSVSFLNSICIIQKRDCSENILGPNIISGSVENVMPGNISHHGKLNSPLDQSVSPWLKSFSETRADLIDGLASKDEHIEKLNQLLADGDMRINELTDAVASKDEHINKLDKLIFSITNTLSWRVANFFRSPIVGLSNKIHNIRLKSFFMRENLLHIAHKFYRKYLMSRRWARWLATQIMVRGYLSPIDIQVSALKSVAGEVYDVPERGPDFLQRKLLESEFDIPGFHMCPPLGLEIHPDFSGTSCINVLLPSLRPKHMSGGPNTALIIAAMLAEKGERVRLIACSVPAEGEEHQLYEHMDNLLKRPVLRDRIELIDACGSPNKNCVGVNDLYFATAWWTAQDAKHIVGKSSYKTFIYLIQDFEALLHEGSTLQARALETYGLSHIPLINTSLLRDYLAVQGIGKYSSPDFSRAALTFEPALDRKHFFPVDKKWLPTKKKVLLFYARPTSARRNLFEIGLAALRYITTLGVIDGDNWEVWAIGEDIPSIPLGNGLYLNPLPWMGFSAYAERIRTADLLLSLMLSPHPSYPPLEMAASGRLVVTNSFSVKTAERLKDYSSNIITAEPTVDSVSEALQSAVGRINIGLDSPDPSGQIKLPTSWDDSLSNSIEYLLDRLKGVRSGRGEMASSDNLILVGSEYEEYKRKRLEVRRLSILGSQEKGLLTFVTSVYDTASEYLLELNDSLLMQDGGVQFEWLILDNGSSQKDTLDTLEMISKNPNVKLLRVEKNLGIIGGMRYLLERAAGRYILPMDSDDIVEPDCVHVVTNFLKDHDYPALVYTDEDKLLNGRCISPYFKPDWDPVLFMHSCYISHLCVIDRKIALELDCYGDPGAEGCHDWDSFIKFSNAGYEPKHLPEVLYSWRMHQASTSGNIGSKSYITDSHRNTLARSLKARGLVGLEVCRSPLFFHNVDWCYRHKEPQALSIQTLDIPMGGMSLEKFFNLIQNATEELIHIIWEGVVPDSDDWMIDSAALLTMFPDTVIIGGLLHGNGQVIDGPKIFGFGEGYGCPDEDRELSDPGYGANLFKAHSVSAVSIAHCIVSKAFLLEVLPSLLNQNLEINILGVWLGAVASERGKRVVYSPFMRAKAAFIPEEAISKDLRGTFISRFWPQFPDTRFYSRHLGLTKKSAYHITTQNNRRNHVRYLQEKMPSYLTWYEKNLETRVDKYPILLSPPTISLLTTVYEHTDMDFLEDLAESIKIQYLAPTEWVIVAHGPLSVLHISFLHKKVGEWGASLVVVPEPQGIIGAMKIALLSAKCDYIVPVDADDLLAADALQILTSSIDRQNYPDLIYSDEDNLTEKGFAAPYLRGGFDPVLNMDNSYIWHLCAIRREIAVNLDIYGDAAATWCHDWSTVLKIFNAGGQIKSVPEILYHWRRHTKSTTNNLIGDSRSLHSTRHLLDQQISYLPYPDLFHVAEWPVNRGVPELYIARTDADLPVFIGMDDFCESPNDFSGANVIVVYSDNRLYIQSSEVYLEVVRLFDLHPRVGAVGGLVVNKDNLIIDSCWNVNARGDWESPWIGHQDNYVGPYALGLKPQSVSLTGQKLAFYRASSLLGGNLENLISNKNLNPAMLSKHLTESGWQIAFSPLVKGVMDSNLVSEFFEVISSCDQENMGTNALSRYGLTKAFS